MGKALQKDDLGNRMKKFYEEIPKTRLMRRTPVIIRIDGKSFHTFTKGFHRPFDDVFMKSMQETTKILCENIQGCVLGYCQSDEISLILQDYQKFETDAWFDYEVQKMCSISASMATMAFHKCFAQNVSQVISQVSAHRGEEDQKEYFKTLQKAADQGAMFDSRVFNMPKEEVTNYIYWRQLDASRNSIQMVGQAFFTHKELQKKSCNEIQDMLMLQKNVNWNNFSVPQKRGSCVIKEEYQENGVTKSRWTIDLNIPIFKGESREYIEKLIRLDE